MYFCAILILSCIRIGKSPLIYHTSKSYSLRGGSSFQRFNEFDNQKKYDIIVVGSSHAARGYDPRIFKYFGIEMYNLGSNAQCLYNTEILINNYIDTNTCKLVILDIYPGTLQSDCFESTSDLVANISDDYTAYQIAKSQKDIRCVNMFVLRMINSFRIKPYYTDSNFIMGGYTTKNDSLAHDLDYKNYFKNFEPLKKNLDSLIRILKYFKEKGVKCILVNHPAPKEISKNKYYAYKEIIKKSNIFNNKFYDYSHSHTLNSKEHFYDYHHMNQAGVTIFNKELINKILKDEF